LNHRLSLLQNATNRKVTVMRNKSEVTVMRNKSAWIDDLGDFRQQRHLAMKVCILSVTVF